MSKAELTKLKIIEKAAELFNSRGYSNTSISDIMQATELKKGGIYNHFKSKEDLVIAAFNFSSNNINQILLDRLSKRKSLLDKLKVFIEVYSNLAQDIPIQGGSPLIKATVECENFKIRDLVKSATNFQLILLRKILNQGISSREISSEIQAEQAAIMILSLLQGASIISRLYRNEKYVDEVGNYIIYLIKNI